MTTHWPGSMSGTRLKCLKEECPWNGDDDGVVVCLLISLNNKNQMALKQDVCVDGVLDEVRAGRCCDSGGCCCVFV